MVNNYLIGILFNPEYDFTMVFIKHTATLKYIVNFLGLNDPC